MDYKDTLNLPKTDFPMKANLPEARAGDARAVGARGHLRQDPRGASAKRPLWILHDGPPYANGHIHMGTSLNKVLKDIVVKSRSMLGHDAVYVPGWDCHGLPIEHQVDKELGLDKAASDVRRAMDPARSAAGAGSTRPGSSTSSAQEFKRLGVFGDWEHPYLTMAPAYQATIVREFGRFVGRGHRLQGPQAGALVHALQDRAGRGRGRVRGPEHAVGLRAVPLVTTASPALATALARQARSHRHLDHDAVDAAGQPRDRGAPERDTSRVERDGEALDRRASARRRLP